MKPNILCSKIKQKYTKKTLVSVIDFSLELWLYMLCYVMLCYVMLCYVICYWMIYKYVKSIVILKTEVMAADNSAKEWIAIYIKYKYI